MAAAGERTYLRQGDGDLLGWCGDCVGRADRYPGAQGQVQLGATAARHVWFRADLMTYIAESTCSCTPALIRNCPSVDDLWWTCLAGSLARLSTVNVEPVAISPGQLVRRISVFDSMASVTVDRWVPAHADLYWAQVTAPGCWILDWEGWGLAPAGFDAASLYLHSLAVPAVAAWVRAVFGRQLDSDDGILSQLYIAARMRDRGDLSKGPIRAAVLAHVDGLLDMWEASGR